MKVIVVGAGQMGSVYGVAAHENGHEVLFVDASAELVDKINADGITVERPDGSVTARVAAAIAPAAGSPADVVLFQVKGYATRAAAEIVKPAVGPDTLIVTFQNGLGNEQVLREVFPGNGLFIGITSHTVVTVGLAHYQQPGVRDTRMGPASAGDLEDARRAASAFDRPGMPVEVLPEKEIRTAQWAKFVFNCGGLAAWTLAHLTIVGSRGQEPLIDLMEALTREACEIAALEGIVLDADERAAFLRNLIATATGGRASMLGDILAKRRTEIDTINGAAVMFADRHGHPAPLNRAMVALVKGLEHAIEIGEA
jgi:2-dehydropantoate 2-reductase